ncbi:DUF6992 family protein [Neolewinella antarctica]|uniref:Uncharacterized protein n=1 Tax=Neolewinella antarctica TaxID=442734 RepID=A0ABX0XBM6_9BACT|nr:hypothetical protein [Neolewinella antarctica]NJC26238.1 hypothetical protein [Neolewinella antarctica]
MHLTATHRFCCLFACFLISYSLAAQAGAPELMAYNEASLAHQRTAMLTLGGWAVANIGVGLALRNGSEGSTRSFHEMNALWNTVNLAIAGFGYYSSVQADPSVWDVMTSLQKHQQFQKVLLFNTGLDVGYVLGGLYLTERAKRPGADGDRLKGFGNSIMLQGSFLFVFDLVNYLIATKLNGTLPLTLGPTAEGLGLLYNF